MCQIRPAARAAAAAMASSGLIRIALLGDILEVTPFLRHRRIERDGVAFELTQREFEVAALLFGNVGKVLSLPPFALDTKPYSPYTSCWEYLSWQSQSEKAPKRRAVNYRRC